MKVDVQRAATLLFYIRREPIQVDTSIVSRVDDNDDGSTISTDKSRAQDQVCVSLFSAPVIIPYRSFHNAFDTICQPVLLFCRSAILPFCFSAVLLFCHSVCTSRRMQMYYI